MNPRLMAVLLTLAGCSQASSRQSNTDSQPSTRVDVHQPDESSADSQTGYRPFKLVEAHRIDDRGGVVSGAYIERQPGQGISITLDLEPEAGATGLYYITCRNGFDLSKGDGGGFARQQPSCGAGPYYFGDQYVENPWVMGCLGCDNQWCLKLEAEHTFSTYELVKTGERSRDGSPSPLSVVEVRPTTGPYQLTLTYYTDSTCSTPALTADPLIIDIK